MAEIEAADESANQAVDLATELDDPELASSLSTPSRDSDIAERLARRGNATGGCVRRPPRLTSASMLTRWVPGVLSDGDLVTGDRLG